MPATWPHLADCTPFFCRLRLRAHIRKCHCASSSCIQISIIFKSICTALFLLRKVRHIIFDHCIRLTGIDRNLQIVCQLQGIFLLRLFFCLILCIVWLRLYILPNTSHSHAHKKGNECHCRCHRFVSFWFSISTHILILLLFLIYRIVSFLFLRQDQLLYYIACLYALASYFHLCFHNHKNSMFPKTP